MKRALITGITGQDGSYLAELLIGKGYEVHGLIRRASDFNTARLDAIYQDPHIDDARLFLHYGDLLDSSSLTRIIEESRPDEVYNLGAQSHVRVSYDMPEYTADTILRGTTSLLNALQRAGSTARFYQAGSSEMYGAVVESPQNEQTPFNPQSPYAAAKVGAHYMARTFRDAYGSFICNGILFNHESPRRGPTFVTRKITRAVAAIVAGEADVVHLGNLDSKRDWGFAPEYVEAMWMMLQADQPDDYVVATGEQHTVREFLECAFGAVDLDASDHVRFDERYLRPAEVDELRGDASKARELLGWQPQTTFEQLVRVMLSADLEAAGLDPEEKMTTAPMAAG